MKTLLSSPSSSATVLYGALAVLLIAVFALPVQAQDLVPQVTSAERVNTSIPLRDMFPVPVPPKGFPYVVPLHDYGGPILEDTFVDDPVVDRGSQSSCHPPLCIFVDLSYEGQSDDDNALVLGFRVVPPDTNGDVGKDHYVQMVNSITEIFDRDTGTSLMGPFASNMFWSGLGGACDTENDGDPVVLYDHLADRWMVSQFAVPGGTNYLCVAVSTTPDPTLSYHQYAFSFGSSFPDYPKFGVWPDAYYATTRSFAPGYVGLQAVAFERLEMLNGNPAQMVVFAIPGGTGIDGFLPADLDGDPPPAGAPGIFAGSDDQTTTRQLEIWEFAVDWGIPANSTFTQHSTSPLTEAAYSYSNADVPQPAPGALLDRLAHFTMHRLQYRNFGTHQTLISNHTVQESGRAAPRWYELRDTGGGWGIHQEGTYAPADGHGRWMGSAAMNGVGEIALGYSISSSTLMPSIYVTAQSLILSGTGVMDLPETVLLAGTGVQTGSFGRWGDYSMMSVDPDNDEQFCYTQEYYANTGSFDFTTRIVCFTVFGIIPVELLSLDAAASGSDIIVNWITSSETNNSGFEVQLRGTGEYEAMGFVEGSGTTTLEQSYSYTISDLAPGAYTVRLKQIDFDGAFEYSPEVEIEVGVPGTHVLTQAYPNPFNPMASFSLTVATAQHVEVVLYNAIGQQVQSLFSGQMEAGEAHALTINGANLPSGPYYYRVIGENFAESGRVTLLK